MDPVKGNVYIDDQNIKKLQIKSLRDSIALVSQDVILFDKSIMKNIAIANPKASKFEIIEASKKADAHNFIIKLKKSYKTITGDRGLNLSGGERQKISIARALIKQPRILLLDEATNSLDSINEIEINKTLDKYFKDKTVIIIAHKLETIKDADNIIVLKDGNMVGAGKYEDLQKENKYFQELINSSFLK